MGTRGRIGEQHLHIARPHVPRIGLVGRPRIAGDAAHDLDLVLIVEAAGRQTVGIVDDQRDLGEMPRGPRGGTGKDHILHLAAAHGGGAVFAHHPAHRLQQVRLAAAIGSDHACQPLMDHQIRGVDKGFEPVQPQLREPHRCPSTRMPSWSGFRGMSQPPDRNPWAIPAGERPYLAAQARAGGDSDGMVNGPGERQGGRRVEDMWKTRARQRKAWIARWLDHRAPGCRCGRSSSTARHP
jgi:hypothetical protein